MSVKWDHRLDGLGLIKEERRRQQNEEGHTVWHDDKHVNGELAIAAACYIFASVPNVILMALASIFWPWQAAWWKPRRPEENLIRAGALIAAELDRRRRLYQRTEKMMGETDA